MLSSSVICVVIALVSQTFICNQLVAANLFSSNAGDLKALCKNESVTLNTLSDLKKLVKNAETPSPDCSENTLEALRELGRIASDRNACSMVKADDITNFADKYLKKEGAEQLPKSLAQFAIAYGMRVSIICKRSMIFTFVPSANRRLRMRFDTAFARFKGYVMNWSPLSMVLSPILKAGDVILPTDFMEAVPGYEAKMKQYISHNAALKRFKKLCERNLQPQYEPIMMPIAKLSRAGFNYRDFLYSLDEKVDKFYWDNLTRQSRFWSIVVFMCESVKNIEVQVDKENQSGSEDQQVMVEELNALNPQPNPLEGVGLDVEDIPEDIFKGPVERYVPDEIVSNKIMGTFDFSLKSMVKSYDANKSERERMKELITKRCFEVFKMMFKKGRNKPVLKRFFTKLLMKKGSEKEYETAVKGMLEMMDQWSEGGSIEYGFAQLAQWTVIGVPWTLIWLTTAAPQLIIQAGRGKTDYLFD